MRRSLWVFSAYHLVLYILSREGPSGVVLNYSAITIRLELPLSSSPPLLIASIHRDYPYPCRQHFRHSVTDSLNQRGWSGERWIKDPCAKDVTRVSRGAGHVAREKSSVMRPGRAVCSAASRSFAVRATRSGCDGCLWKLDLTDIVMMGAGDLRMTWNMASKDFSEVLSFAVRDYGSLQSTFHHEG